MSKPNHINIFIGDWIRDTRMLSPEARGVYTELIMYLTRSDTPGTMDFVITNIHVLLGFCYDFVTPIFEELKTKSPLTITYIDANTIRVTHEEMMHKAAVSASRSKAGKEGMKKKYAKPKAPEIDFVNTFVITKTITNSDIDIGKDIGKEIEDKRGVQGGEKETTQTINFNLNQQPPEELPFKSNDFKKLWETWKLYKLQQHHFKYAAITERHALEQLVQRSNYSEKKAIEIIKFTISKGYKNLEDYGSNNNQGNKPSITNPIPRGRNLLDES